MSTPTHQNQDGPAQTVLGITAAAGAIAWFGYHYLNSHAATINLPLLITLLTALCVTLLCAAHTWRATHPRPAEHAATATDRWRLAFPVSSATAATAGAVFTPTLAVTSWACHAPLVPAAGLAAAAAITAAGFTWERYRLQAGRTALRTTLIQALYAPLGHRYPCPAVVPTINWQPKSTVPDNLTIRAQRASIHHHLGDHPAAQFDEDAAPRGDTAATVRKALRAHCNGHYRVATDPSGLRLTATHYVPEKIDEQLTDLIRKVRAVFGPSAMVPADTVTKNGDTITGFTIKHDMGHKLTGEFRKRFTEQNLTELIGGTWRTQWHMEASTVDFAPKPILRKIIYPEPVAEVRSIAEAVGQYRQTRIAYGVDLDMKPQEWDPLDSPHTLVGGKTGAGKTVYLRTNIMQLARRGWAIVLVDFKGGSFSDLVGWPNVHIISSDPYESIATIHRMYKLMNERNARARWDHKQWENNLPYLIVVDEAAQFNVVLNRLWNGGLKPQRNGPKEPPTVTELNEMARLSRTARMHVVLGMQRPDHTLLDTEARDNFGNRVSVGPISRIAAEMLFEDSYTGRFVPRIKGRGMSTGTHEQPRETQYFYTPAADTIVAEEARVIAALRPSATLIPRYVPELPSDLTAASWNDIAEAKWYPLSERPDLDPTRISRTITQWAGGDSRLGFDEPTGDEDEVVEIIVPASELEPGDVLTLDGRTACVDGIELDTAGAVTVMWEDDAARLCVSTIAPDELHTVVRSSS